MNERGEVVEELTHSEDAAGNLIWDAPSTESAELRVVIETQLQKRGFRIVPFQEILDPQNGYSILVFNAYYTPVLSKDEARQVQVVSTRLSGVLLPKDLDVSKKQNRIFQASLARFNTGDNVLAAIKTSFKQSVEHIGENGQWVETCPLLD
jgi:hypothetical protein